MKNLLIKINRAEGVGAGFKSYKAHKKNSVRAVGKRKASNEAA